MTAGLKPWDCSISIPSRRTIASSARASAKYPRPFCDKLQIHAGIGSRPDECIDLRIHFAGAEVDQMEYQIGAAQIPDELKAPLDRARIDRPGSHQHEHPDRTIRAFGIRYRHRRLASPV